MLKFELMLQDLVLALRLQALDRKIATLDTEIRDSPQTYRRDRKALGSSQAPIRS